jgi:hypothetical protein
MPNLGSCDRLLGEPARMAEQLSAIPPCADMHGGWRVHDLPGMACLLWQRHVDERPRTTGTRHYADSPELCRWLFVGAVGVSHWIGIQGKKPSVYKSHRRLASAYEGTPTARPSAMHSHPPKGDPANYKSNGRHGGPSVHCRRIRFFHILFLSHLLS